MKGNGGLAEGAGKPLEGVRILDLTRLLPGAFCTQLLADLGAEVIKIEQPGRGDYWRWAAPRVATQSAQFLALNRGKRSVTLDLKSDAGREVLLRLVGTADILVESFRPGVMDRLGLSVEALRAANARLVTCAITGFGQTGPDAGLAAHDLNYLGLAGMLRLVKGAEAEPTPTGLPIGDLGGGALMAAAGILAALRKAERTGVGVEVDTSVLDGLFTWAGFVASGWNAPGMAGTDDPFDAPFNRPFYTVYATRDGRQMVVGCYEEKFWRTFCTALERPDWLERQWDEGAAQEDLRAQIAAAFADRTQADLVELFSRNEACVTPVLTMREALASDQAQARGTMIEVDDPVEGRLRLVGGPFRIDGTRMDADGTAPQLGQDTQDVLRDLGYADVDVSEMRASGAI